MYRETTPKSVTPFFTLALLLAAVVPSHGAPPAAKPSYVPGFPVTLGGDFIRFGSVALGDLNGDTVPDIVVGGSDGVLHAYTGNGTFLWSVDTGDAAIEGKPAIGDIDGDNWNEVVVGAGSTFTPSADGVLIVYDHLGNEQCRFTPLDQDGDTWADGVYSSPALVDLDGNPDGHLEIVFTSWDERVRALYDNCDLYWARQTYDTIWSSPAIGDLNRDGSPEVVIASPAHEHVPLGIEDGGQLYVFTASGGDYAGFPIQIDEAFKSSPALGDIDGDGYLDIVIGTGNCWGINTGCGTTYYPGAGEYLNAWDRNGNALPGWPVAVPTEVAESSPALADLDEDGRLEVIINTRVRGTVPGDGWVYALNGDGSSVPGWPVRPSTPAGCHGETVFYGTEASPIVADVTGDGHLEVILPSKSELVVWDKDGVQLSRTSLVQPLCEPPDTAMFKLVTNGGVSGSAAVGDVDGDDDLELLVAGYAEPALSTGGLWAWDFSAAGTAAQPWPAFRRDPAGLAMVSTATIFTDGFESGNTSKWTLQVSK